MKDKSKANKKEKIGKKIGELINYGNIEQPKQKPSFNFSKLVIPAIILMLIIAGIFLIRPAITGFAVAENITNETVIDETTIEDIINEPINFTEEEIKTITLKEVETINETANATEEEIKVIVMNRTTESDEINKTITIDLEYKSGTEFDSDDDGVEPVTGIIDLTVENSLFSWDVDESNLCTRWESYSVDDGDSITYVSDEPITNDVLAKYLEEKEDWE